MALGIKKLKIKELTPLDKLKNAISKNPYLSDENKKKCLEIDPSIYNFGGEENFISLMYALISNKNICERDINKFDINKVLEDAAMLYSHFPSAKESFSQFLKLFNVNGIYEFGIFSEEVLSNFETLDKYFQAMNMIINHPVALKDFEETKRLITSLGVYTPNDIELNSMLGHFFTNSNFAENYSDLVDYAIEHAKKRAGVYDDLSDEYLAKMDALINKSMATVGAYKAEEEHIKSLAESLRLLRADAEKRVKTFEEYLKRLDEEMEKMAGKYTDKIESSYVSVFAQIKNDYLEIVKTLTEKADTEAKKAALQAVEKLETAAKDLESIKDRYKLQTEDMEELKRTATDEVRRGLKEIRETVERLGIDSDVDLSKIIGMLNTSNPNVTTAPSQTIITPAQGIVVPNSYENIKLPEVIMPFDETIEFKKRYNEIMRRKEQQESEGVVYNEVIDVCIYFMLRNFYPYLYGPSGAGKNYFVKQLADLFKLPCLDIGYVTDELDIVGGTNAYGTYSPTNFFECWLNGYIGFANEFDNSIAQAAIKLNTFLDKETGEDYKFRGIVSASRHPNFRIIAAGNTTGMGANHAYNARQKFDESIQQRFKYVKFDFDDKVERDILKDFKEWYEFAKLFRSGLNNFWKYQENEIEGQITTRDLRDIAIEAKDKILSDEEILQYEFIEAKDADCLTSISQYMREHDDGLSNGATKLVKKFNNIVDSQKGSVKK